MNFVAFDVETANSSGSSICQLGLVKVVNGTIVKEESFLIQPPKNCYGLHNSMIHGLSALSTKTAPLFPEIWDKIENEFSNSLIVAHNAAFDISCLRQTLAFYNIKVPDFHYECTYNLTGKSLKTICQAYLIDLGQHHDALCDARACAKVYIKLAKGEQPDFTMVSENKKSKYSIFEGHERITGDLLKPDLVNGDCNSPFFNKKVVFTGILKSMERNEAAKKVKELGADIDTSITRKTRYVITGTAPGPAKLALIEKYQEEGYEIDIVDENRFLKMLKS